MLLNLMGFVVAAQTQPVAIPSSYHLCYLVNYVPIGLN